MTTSDRRGYVYLQLPQSLEGVTAGYYAPDFPQGVATGSFVYNPAYRDRADALPLEPYELPLNRRLATTIRVKGIFGVLRDALPDAWGRRIIERHTGRRELNEVDYQARAIVDQVQQVVAAQWRPMLQRHGVSDAECQRLSPAFNYPGFELDPLQALPARG